MKTVGDYFEEAKVSKLTCLLYELDMFILAYHEEMSKEEYYAFQRVTEYIADMDVDKL